MIKYDNKILLFSFIKSGSNVMVDSKFNDETTILGFNELLQVNIFKLLIFHFVNNLNQCVFTEIFLEC